VPRLDRWAALYNMRAYRLLLLPWMVLVVVAMVFAPGSYDTRRRATATRDYLVAPSEETRQALSEAKRQERRNILIFECVMLGVLGLSGYAFVRSRRPDLGGVETLPP